MLILPRHASFADTMFPLALAPRIKNMRHVLKAELLSDPGLDIVGHRFPNTYVHRSSGHSEEQIAKVLTLSENLPEDAAVVIWPEGTRFTRSKREHLLAKFKDKDPKLFAITKLLKSSLSPLRGGGLALLESMPPDTDVVFISHRGIDASESFRDLINGSFKGSHLEIAIWKVDGSLVPRDPVGAERFMLENWLKIDAWAQGKSLNEALSIDEVLSEHPEITFGDGLSPAVAKEVAEAQHTNATTKK